MSAPLRPWRAVAAGVLLGALASGCATSTSPPSSAPAPDRGTVQVLYAGSLVDLMVGDIGPSFTASTGYRFSGFAGGSAELANEVKGQVRRADVFVSASPAVDQTLVGARNGDWVSWYAAFARAPLVIGYNPHSRFAAELRSEPWYEVVSRPGFLLGRTDPALDPKGKLTVEALEQAAASHHEPALLAATKSSANVFPEQSLVGRLQAGQLDAGFFYSNEARTAHIPSVVLGAGAPSATYTVTVLERAPDVAGARAFVAYLLGPSGRSKLRSSGLEVLVPPKVSGEVGAAPASVRRPARP